MTWLPVQEIQGKDSYSVNVVLLNNYGQLSGRRVISQLADFSGLILHLANKDYPNMALGVHSSVCQVCDLLMSNGFISAFTVTHRSWRFCATRRSETSWHDGKCQKHPWSEIKRKMTFGAVLGDWEMSVLTPFSQSCFQEEQDKSKNPILAPCVPNACGENQSRRIWGLSQPTLYCCCEESEGKTWCLAH